MNRCKTMYLFMNRNVMAFDADGNQIVEYQRAITCYQINRKLAMQATIEADELYIGSWGDWRKPIDRKCMQYLLGLRTRAMDMADIDAHYAELEIGTQTND